MSRSTAGKGPGVLMRARNRSGALRVSVGRNGTRALLDLLDASGHLCQVGLEADEVRTLARALDQVARTLEYLSSGEEETTCH